MKKEIKSGVIMAISFGLTLGLIGVTYAAFVNVTSVSPTDTLTADLMNNVINNQKDLDSRIGSSGTPAGFVGAFYLSTCPTGWSEANGSDHTLDLRGTFIRGINGDANSRDTSRTLGSYQADDYLSHLHSVNPPSTTSSSAGNHRHTYIYYKTERSFGDGGARAVDYDQGSTTGSTGYAGTHTHTTNIAAFNSASSGGTETRPKNVALLYCVKD